MGTDTAARARASAAARARATARGLRFVNRRDEQTKLGGRRIELAQVEAALCTAPGVRAAAAAIRESVAGNRLLVGYVVGEADPAAVRAHVGRRLPAGMVPLVAVVAELPRSPSGKLDRAALPWPTGGDAQGQKAGIGADGTTLTDTETWLAERWTDQLGPVPLVLHSDFFALGGASFAAKLAAALRIRYPAVAVADVYAHPTLRELARRLEALGAAGESGSAELRPATMRAVLARTVAGRLRRGRLFRLR